MKKSIVFMFSGQGSQYYHMGKELYESHPRFRMWMNHCNDIVRPLIQTSLVDIIYGKLDKSRPFDRVLYTNPALLCVEYSLTRLLMEMEIYPDCLLGYSLGEITASIVSGAIPLEEGIRLVVGYAELLEDGTRPAAMLAIIESMELVEKIPEFFKNCRITGKNFHNNFVVSGLLEDIRHLEENLKQKNIIYQRLPVNYGFHTELIDPIEFGFKRLAGNINIDPIDIPIISAAKVEKIGEVTVDYLWNVTRFPVEFEKTVHFMLQENDCIFIDVGPSGSLATSIKYILPSNSSSHRFEVINQFGKDLSSIEKLRVGLSAVNNVVV